MCVNVKYWILMNQGTESMEIIEKKPRYHSRTPTVDILIVIHYNPIYHFEMANMDKQNMWKLDEHRKK